MLRCWVEMLVLISIKQRAGASLIYGGECAMGHDDFFYFFSSGGGGGGAW